MGEGRKRYNLTLPAELYAEVERLAHERDTTVLELLRRFIKLGLIVAKAEDTDTAAITIREGERVREIMLL